MPHASRQRLEGITLCASDETILPRTCGGTWDQGYIVFVDLDGNIAVHADDDTILRAQPAIADGVTLKVADDARYFSFAATGLGRANVGGNPALSQVVMCDDRGNITAAGGNSAARLFVATPLGRATIQRDKSMIQDVLDVLGSCP